MIYAYLGPVYARSGTGSRYDAYGRERGAQRCAPVNESALAWLVLRERLSDPPCKTGGQMKCPGRQQRRLGPKQVAGQPVAHLGPVIKLVSP